MVKGEVKNQNWKKIQELLLKAASRILLTMVVLLHAWK